MALRFPRFLLMLTIGLSLGLGALAPTIRPVSYDFGPVAVNGMNVKTFIVTLPRSIPTGTTLTGKVVGPNAADFLGDGVAEPLLHCGVSPQAVICDWGTSFRPKSLGPKTARLELTDNHGALISATLKGMGVQPLCRHEVVPCNFSHLYSGTFTWTSTLTGPKSSYSEHVTVTVVNGVASCNGGATDVDNGQTQTGSMTGDGLIGVEFLRDDTYRLVYKITVACPTPDFPNAPSRPAELGHYEQSSDEQEASDYGINLKGAISYPSPDDDPLNGVKGTVSINWDLKRS